MTIQIENKTFEWLRDLNILNKEDSKQTQKNTWVLKQNVTHEIQNATKVSQVIIEIYKKKGVVIPTNLYNLKQTNQIAGKLYNWNIVNQSLKKIGLEIDSQTKNFIINGDHQHVNMILRKLQNLYFMADSMQDSLDTLQKITKTPAPPHLAKENQLTLSYSIQQPQIQHVTKKQQILQEDLLEFIVSSLSTYLKLTKKQAVGLLSENNKYLAHVLVKGIKGQFSDIEEFLKKIYQSVDYVVDRMVQQNDMCFFFLQAIKPSLLSKSEEIAQWGCRILTKVAYQLADKEMLPLAYDWFVRESGGLSTTLLALNRHPKLSPNVVGYILQFARYNVTQLFTIQLRKVTNNDNLQYMKFVLLIFDSLIQSKSSSQQLLNSGAIDYWVEMCNKGAEGDGKNSQQLRIVCIQLLIKIWKGYSTHIQESVDQVNTIMNNIKRGIRQNSQVMKFTLMEMLFSLLDHFANLKNPYASIVYKKLTFLFIQNHQETTVRQFMLRNFQNIFNKYQSIPVEIFLQPFIKQIKISQSKSYMMNLFDFQFIEVVVKHKKLKTTIGLQLFDLLAKTKLNNYVFNQFADESMQVLLDRFLSEELFVEYTVKLVKISLAMFYSTLKNKKQFDDHERIQAQKRSQIVNFIISLIERNNSALNQQIKQLVIHVKVQIYKKIGTQHRGIERILSHFQGIQQQVEAAFNNIRDQSESNTTSVKSKNEFHLPKIQRRQERDQATSQQSFKTSSSKISKQEFPIKDYSDFAAPDEKKFLEENGIGLKKKIMSKSKRTPSYEKEIDPKLQEQIFKIKQKREQEVQKKAKENQQILRKKQILKMQIQKELQQRNLKQGHRGIQKDVEVKVLFPEGQIQENILEDDQSFNKQLISIKDEDRNHQSIKLVLKKYSSFIKKIFTKYCVSRNAKKDYFEEQSECMSQVDLIKMCNQKGIQKNKQIVVELLKTVNNGEVNKLQINGFVKFLQGLCIIIGQREKFTPHLPLGQLMKVILYKMSSGERFKLDEDDDQLANDLTEKVRYNPHIVLPQNYKKIYEMLPSIKNSLSYSVVKSGNESSYFICFDVVSEIFNKMFGFHLTEEIVNFSEQARVISKKATYIPPRPAKKQKEQTTNLNLEQLEKAPKVKAKINTVSHKSLQKSQSQSIEKDQVKKVIVNAAEKKKLQEQQEKRKKKQEEQQKFKIRQTEVKKKLENQQLEREREKSKKKQQTKQAEKREIQRIKKEKQQKERYRREQKEKLESYKREQQEKQKEEKDKNKKEREKEEEDKKEKYKMQKLKEEEKRKQEYERVKRQREMSVEKDKNKRQQEEKKKQVVKKQAMKKLQNEKQKYQTNKLQKQILKQIYQQPQINKIFTNHKQQIKGLFNYGTEFNQHKIEQIKQNQISQKGWLTICQQLSICDTNTAVLMLKQHIRQSKQSGYSFDGFQQALLIISTKKELQNDLQEYENLKKACGKKLEDFLNDLKIPKEKQRIKDFFAGLKNNKSKEQVGLVGPNGEKQTWQIN